MRVGVLEASRADYLVEMAQGHDCFSHPLFEHLRSESLTGRQAVALLFDYDAHASLLRRLLLKAAACMPEPAVGFILENVRNEYGNGSFERCHQGQLRDLIERVSRRCSVDFTSSPVSSGVRRYLGRVVRYYSPGAADTPSGFYRPAIVAGAITATEIMAIEEFKALQIAFKQFGLEHHRWFDHVEVECEHSDESLALAEYFLDSRHAHDAVEFGFSGTLAANSSLYDGLLECASSGAQYPAPAQSRSLLEK